MPAENFIQQFFVSNSSDELPVIYKALVEDAAAVLEFDPAAKFFEQSLIF